MSFDAKKPSLLRNHLAIKKKKKKKNPSNKINAQKVLQIRPHKL